MRKSKAVVLERPFRASFRDVELMEETPDSVVCRTTMSAISSGTDMKTWAGRQHPEQCWYPLVPGYENVGVVERVGPEAKTALRPGDRVMINECRRFGDVCAAWGGNVHHAVKNQATAASPFDYAVKIPDNVSDQDAVLAYLACVALKGAKRFAFVPGETVVVVGAGMVGLSAVQIIKLLNPAATVVSVDRSGSRRAVAARFADHALLADGSEVDKLMELTNGKKADKVMECSGAAEVVGTLHKYLKDGGWAHDDAPGHIHLQGDYPEPIVLDSWHRWFGKNCQITMSCALSPGCKEQVLGWMSEGKFKSAGLPVETWRAEDCHAAFEHKRRGGEEVLKILFDWSHL